MWSKMKFNYFSYKWTYICSDPTPEAIVKKALNAFLERSQNIYIYLISSKAASVPWWQKLIVSLTQSNITRNKTSEQALEEVLRLN